MVPNVPLEARKWTSVPRRSLRPVTLSGSTATPSRNSIWFPRPPVAKLDLVPLPVTPDREAQPLGERVHHRYADAVQATRYLVRVGVEFAAGVQLGHDDLGGRALGLVVVLDTGGDAAAVVDDRDRVVRVDRHGDLVAEAGEGFVDRVVHDLQTHGVHT